jgi:transposase-like protein
MEKLVNVGDFCPNEDCEDYGQTGRGNIRKYGKTEKGIQRNQCKTCHSTFVETKGTLFYRRRIDGTDIIETLAMLAEGMRISSITRVKGFKEDTILAWLRKAAQHAEQIEAILLKDYGIGQSQIDGLWTYVGQKGKKQNVSQKIKGNTGAAL